MKTLLVVENAPTAPLANFAPVLARRGVAVTRITPTDLVSGWRLHGGFEGLMLLGGPQDSYDDEQFPAAGAEMALIREFDAAGKPVLGICLGAQVMARAFGAQAFRHPAGLEWGYVNLRQTSAGAEDPLIAGLEKAPVLESHQDTMSLPDGAVLLASSLHTPLQIWRQGARSYAFQCHIEAGAEQARHWLALRFGSRPERAAAEAALEAELALYADEARRYGETVLERWLDLAANGPE
jgi:GMP synthase (glutamine-hydrolysing)